jgi:hypothetical protein
MGAMHATAAQRSTDRNVDQRSDVYEEALSLARAIEALLEGAAAKASGSEGYGLRLSEAMTRSLIDQLDELKRVRPL